LEGISDAATSAIDEVHEIAHNLRPYELDRLGLVQSIKSMIGKISDSSSTRVSTDLDPIDGLLSPAAETSVYRIVQEGLNNVVKHAEATDAQVGIKRLDRQLVISVADNGKGVKPQDGEGGNGHGFGLAGIAERARMLGGSSAIESQPEKGTTLIVTIGLSEKGNGRQSQHHRG
jgi:signal transduction histidine kinase